MSADALLSRASTEICLDRIGEVAENKGVKLSPEDEWMAKVDLEKFAEEIKSLGKTLAAQQGDLIGPPI